MPLLICSDLHILQARIREVGLVAGRLRAHDCAAHGNQVVIAPDGEVGLCHAYTGSKRFFFGNVSDAGLRPPEELLRQWRLRTPFAIPACRNCPAIGICGGGCAYEAELETGDFRQPDSRYCTHCRDLLEWYLGELLARAEERGTAGLFIANISPNNKAVSAVT